MKTIDQDTYLKALALFHLAKEHTIRSWTASDALARLLKGEDTSTGSFDHIGDILWSRDDYTVAMFNDALRREGFTTEQPVELSE